MLFRALLPVLMLLVCGSAHRPSGGFPADEGAVESLRPRRGTAATKERFQLLHEMMERNLRRRSQRAAAQQASLGVAGGLSRSGHRKSFASARRAGVPGELRPLSKMGGPSWLRAAVDNMRSTSAAVSQLAGLVNGYEARVAAAGQAGNHRGRYAGRGSGRAAHTLRGRRAGGRNVRSSHQQAVPMDVEEDEGDVEELGEEGDDRAFLKRLREHSASLYKQPPRPAAATARSRAAPPPFGTGLLEASSSATALPRQNATANLSAASKPHRGLSPPFRRAAQASSSSATSLPPQQNATANLSVAPAAELHPHEQKSALAAPKLAPTVAALPAAATEQSARADLKQAPTAAVLSAAIPKQSAPADLKLASAAAALVAASAEQSAPAKLEPASTAAALPAASAKQSALTELESASTAAALHVASAKQSAPAELQQVATAAALPAASAAQSAAADLKQALSAAALPAASAEQSARAELKPASPAATLPAASAQQSAPAELKPAAMAPALPAASAGRAGKPPTAARRTLKSLFGGFHIPAFEMHDALRSFAGAGGAGDVLLQLLAGSGGGAAAIGAGGAGSRDGSVRSADTPERGK
eukprot:TRINITY_DN22957_c0_g2_i2.p1 TRINITY_DN22957_c0_g2~~TRINITY_DN22957_c0_g2_i2.p1  ORF type:complete len:591 (-),score=166.05 TRINITY_DN22957_c0_g2_i2:82-1854(-)